ncbi:TetR/AcrR family transcriptional regulator [Sphingobacterium sp. HJSM2_6]|uniref:TetR/AcrR family transcriptional regulator n=1 Tax=Sphingobacterium sp. HJSM2_6 TaxID=3366264 RepID=UPI003BCF2A33
MGKKRGLYQGPIRNVEIKKKRFKETIKKIFKERAFSDLTVNAVSYKAGISKSLLYRYFGNLNNLLSQLMEENDFSAILEEKLAEEKVLGQQQDSNHFADMLRYLLSSPVSSGLVAWELSSQNRSIYDNLKKREEILQQLFLEKEELKNSNVDVQAIYTILFSSINYLSAYSFMHEVPINGIRADLEPERIISAIQFILNQVKKVGAE